MYQYWLIKSQIKDTIVFYFFLVYLSGTRIIYERKFLLELRNSPLSRTPPRNLPLIPGVTCDEKVKPGSPKDNGVPTTESENDKNDHGESLDLFVKTLFKSLLF